MQIKSLAVPFAAVLAVVAGWWVGNMMPRGGTPISEQLSRVSDEVAEGAPALAGGHVMHPARPVAAFSLLSDEMQPVSESSLEGQWTFLFMGYTYCPDICPVTLTELDQLHRAVDAEGQESGAPIKSLFVSVDPRRDTPERLREYTGYFNAAIDGVTGESKQLEQFAKAMRLVYLPAPDEPADANYLVDHSAQVVLTNPKGELQAIFPPPHSGSVIAEDFRSILAWWEQQSG